MAGIRKKPTKGGLWQAWFIDYTGKKKFLTADTKRRALQAAQDKEAEHRQIRNGFRPPPGTADRNMKRSFESVVDEYLEWGEAQGGRGGRPWGKTHARNRRTHLAWWQGQLGFESLGDVKGCLPRVERALRQLQRVGRAGKTLNNYAEALAALCDWCKQRGYLDHDPLEGFARFDGSPQTLRRAMSAEEIAQLLPSCAPHRQLFYKTAFLSGLRANELRSLTVSHLDRQQCGLRLDAAWTKNRKDGFQSLPGWLVEELHTFAVGGEATHLYKRFCRRSDKLDGLPESPLLYVPSHTSRALDADLEAAGIAKHGPGGKIDFHACRVAFINLVLENQKVTPREAQELARHATTELTMNVYGRVRQDRLSQIVEEVGEFLRPAEPQVVPGLYRAAVGSELKSATSSPTRDCASNQLVEAASTR